MHIYNTDGFQTSANGFQTSANGTFFHIDFCIDSETEIVIFGRHVRKLFKESNWTV